MWLGYFWKSPYFCIVFKKEVRHLPDDFTKKIVFSSLYKFCEATVRWETRSCHFFAVHPIPTFPFCKKETSGTKIFLQQKKNPN